MEKRPNKTYKPNILKPSKKPQKVLKNVIFYDCECYTGEHIDKNTFDGIEKYKTYLICADFNNELKTYQNISKKQNGFTKTIEQEFWNDVVEFAQGKEIYIYAHFAQADLIMSQGIPILQKMGFKEKKNFSYKSPFFFTYTLDNTIINLRDSFSIFSMGLSIIGEELGDYKGDFEDHHIRATSKNLQERIDYCLQDVKIMKTAILNFEEFLLEKWGTGLKITSASTAFNVFKQRFIKNEIEIHTRESAIVIEREAYHGGRTEMWKEGKYKDLYYIDVNSMYPFVMRNYKYPTKLIFNTSCWMKNEKEVNILLKKIKSYIAKGFLVTGTFEIETDIPVYAKKTKEHTIFPIGKFYTGLNTEEIKFAFENKHIKTVLDFCVYDGETIFDNYVNELYTLRQEYKDTFYEVLIKLLLNSLYGKFGQLDTTTIELQNERYPEGLNTFEFKKIDGLETKVDILNGRCYIRKHQGNTYNTFVSVAGHVTSNARMLLWECISKAKHNNVYYMDTDSLFLSEEGYNNILDAGLINTNELGKFKLECKIIDADFRGCKDYKITYMGKNKKTGQMELKTKNRIKGVNAKAEIVDDNTFKMKRPLTINDCKKIGCFDSYGSVIVEKHLKRIYKKGTKDGNNILPFIYNETKDEYLDLKFKRKKNYLKERKKKENEAN